MFNGIRNYLVCYPCGCSFKLTVIIIFVFNMFTVFTIDTCSFIIIIIIIIAYIIVSAAPSDYPYIGIIIICRLGSGNKEEKCSRLHYILISDLDLCNTVLIKYTFAVTYRKFIKTNMQLILCNFQLLIGICITIFSYCKIFNSGSNFTCQFRYRRYLTCFLIHR